MSAKKKARVYHYEGCGTCKKARAWLLANDVKFELIPIVESPPSRAELEKLIERSGLEPKKWINTSGGSYRAAIEAEGKEKVASWSSAELIDRLSKDGKMIKRPVVVTDDVVLVGFNEASYAATFRSR